jgi:hypothetical protein
LDLNKKRTRQKSNWQIYSTLYYDTKLKTIITGAWEAKYRAENPAHDPSKPIPTPPLAFRNEQTRELYQSESEEVHREVEAKAKEGEGGGPSAELADVDENLDPAEISHISKLRSYQRLVAFQLISLLTFKSADDLTLTIQSQRKPSRDIGIYAGAS